MGVKGRGKVSVLRMRSGQICPDKVVVPLRYTNIISLTPATSVSYQWAQNGLWQCDLMVGGTSPPVGWLQWMSFYTRYRVLGTSFRVTIINPSSSAVAFSIAASDVNVGGGAGAVFIANLKFAPVKDVIWVGQAQPPRTKALKVNTSELLGEKQYDEANLYGDVGSNPTHLQYLILGTTVVGTSATINVAVEIEYLAEFTEAQNQPGNYFFEPLEAHEREQIEPPHPRDMAGPVAAGPSKCSHGCICSDSLPSRTDSAVRYPTLTPIGGH